MDNIQRNEAYQIAEEPYDTSSKEQVNKARKKAARTRKDRLEFVKASMSLEEGRSWFYDIMNRCAVFTNPFEGEDTHRTAFRLGEQNIGKQILVDVLDAAPDQYMRMIEENKR